MISPKTVARAFLTVVCFLLASALGWIITWGFGHPSLIMAAGIGILLTPHWKSG